MHEFIHILKKIKLLITEITFSGRVRITMMVPHRTQIPFQSTTYYVQTSTTKFYEIYIYMDKRVTTEHNNFNNV